MFIDLKHFNFSKYKENDEIEVEPELTHLPNNKKK